MHEKDIRTDDHWFGHFYTDSSMLVLRITESPVEKQRSFKAEATVEKIGRKGKYEKVKGKLLLYFSKEDSTLVPQYGDRILIHGGLQTIRNSGNPGAFDYERYLSFQQVFHQIFLKKDQYALLKDRKEYPLYSFIFLARNRIINILRKNIKGDKKVTGITEALLIGYKEDLDKDTVQAYSNTGVVHIIAISGMHLGLIYVVLVWCLFRVPLIKKMALLRVVLILSCLWLFSLITGASASVIRSAVMFTCIIVGKTFFKQANIYNSLATSAFLLLCYDPFLVWDVGFQLSYLAVIGIVWLQRPIFNLWYIKNNFLQKIWEMTAICLAAQVLTLPICIYYFHQIPTTFLVTNLICVPLSTIILFSEIAVLLVSVSSYLSGAVGKFTYILTWLMNFFINVCNNLPFSLLDNIRINELATALLYAVVLLLCNGLLHKKKLLLKCAIASIFVFTGIWSYEKILALRQKKIIIYNISRHTAVDFVAGEKYVFYGEDAFQKDLSLENFQLTPARISLQAFTRENKIPPLQQSGKLWQFYSKKMMIVDTATNFQPLAQKIRVDVLLLSHNPRLSITDLSRAITPAIIVFDASNSLWKIGQWKKECEQLHLRCYSTAEQGAFITDAAAQ